MIIPKPFKSADRGIVPANLEEEKTVLSREGD